MSVFKEQAETLTKVAQNQTRIYNDAADWGYPYNTSNPPNDIKWLIETITQLKELDAQFPEEKPMVRNRQTWGDGVSVDVVIFWENDGTVYYGTRFHVCFNKTHNHPSLLDKTYNAYISVDVEAYEEEE